MNIEKFNIVVLMATDQDFKLEVVKNMKQYGGSFVKCLAECFITADPINNRKLTITFFTYVKEYLPESYKQVSKGGGSI